MTKDFKRIFDEKYINNLYLNIKVYLYCTPISMIFNYILDTILFIIYLLNILYFYTNIIPMILLNLELDIFFMRNPFDDSDKFQNFNNNNNNNNFNNENFYMDFEDENYPRIYKLPDKRIIARDWDKISCPEIFKRVCITKLITTVNKPNVDFGIKWGENFSKIYMISSAYNIKYSLMTKNSAMANHYINNGIWSSFTTPAIEGVKIGLSAAYATSAAITEANNEKYYNIKAPQSILTQVINSKSPYTDTTFSLNDTWDENIKGSEIIREYAKEATKKYIEHITPGCEIF